MGTPLEVATLVWRGFVSQTL